jgi:hypothetical protein
VWVGISAGAHLGSAGEAAGTRGTPSRRLPGGTPRRRSTAPAPAVPAASGTPIPGTCSRHTGLVSDMLDALWIPRHKELQPCVAFTNGADTLHGSLQAEVQPEQLPWLHFCLPPEELPDCLCPGQHASNAPATPILQCVDTHSATVWWSRGTIPPPRIETATANLTAGGSS